MAKRQFADLVSMERLRLWAKARERDNGLVYLAQMLLERFDAGDPAGAETVFFDALGFKYGDYFYSMTATTKLRFVDGIAVGFCETKDAQEELFQMMKDRGVIGKTRRSPQR